MVRCGRQVCPLCLQWLVSSRSAPFQISILPPQAGNHGLANFKPSTTSVLSTSFPTMGRVCVGCARDLPETSYTGSQLFKGPGASRCAGCVHGHSSDNAAAQQSDSGRYNISNHAIIPLDALENPFASGVFRLVAKGSYISGPRFGQACVVKWFNTGAVFENDYFALDIKAVHKALGLVNRFNQLKILNKTVKINVPQVWILDDAHGKWAGQKVMCEPFIQDYQKFNSNTGWNDNSQPWGQAMQALSRKYSSKLEPCIKEEFGITNTILARLQLPRFGRQLCPLRPPRRHLPARARAVRPSHPVSDPSVRRHRPRERRHHLLFQAPCLQPLLPSPLDEAGQPTTSFSRSPKHDHDPLQRADGRVPAQRHPLL